jgi:hypothetical protein
MAGELNLSSPMDGPIDCVRLAVCVCACLLPLLRGGGACQTLGWAAWATIMHGPPLSYHPQQRPACAPA